MTAIAEFFAGVTVAEWMGLLVLALATFVAGSVVTILFSFARERRRRRRDEEQVRRWFGGRP